MHSQLKGAIFDFNGVIIDDYFIQKESWCAIALELRGQPVTDEEMLGQIRGTPTRNTIERMAQVGGSNLSEIEIIQYQMRKDALVRDLFKHSLLITLTNGLTNFLESLSQHNIPLTIASSSSLENLEIVLDRFNLTKWFDTQTLIHRDSMKLGKKLGNKPLPDPYLAAAQILELKSDECVVFEDSLSGIQSAQAAGIKTIIAVNSNPIHLAALTTTPCVTKGINDFSEITVEELFLEC